MIVNTRIIMIIVMIFLTLQMVSALKIITNEEWKQGSKQIIQVESKAYARNVSIKITDPNGNMVYYELNMPKVSSNIWAIEYQVPSNFQGEKAFIDIQFYDGRNKFYANEEVHIKKLNFFERIWLKIRTHANFEFIDTIKDNLKKHLNIT